MGGYREGDARTALCRGLAEYLEDSIDFEAEGGRRFSLYRVFSSWAEPEDEAQYPSAYVSMGAATYDASRFTPGLDADQKVPAPDNRYAITLAEMTADLSLELWCTDPVERAELVTAIEQALNPRIDVYGMTLELPWFYNLRAVYSLSSLQYIDSEEEAMRRYRRAVFTIAGQIPVIKLVSVPDAKPRVLLEEVGSDVVLQGVIVRP
jgi:hypothetical protein